MTIKQIFGAEQSEGNVYSVDGKTLHRVKVVGQIMERKPIGHTILFQIDDGTGRIETRYWPQEEDDAEDEETEQSNGPSEAKDWIEGVYVRIFGHIRKFGNSERISLVALSIQPLEDFNEVTFHFLETCYVHLKCLKEAKNTGFSNMNFQQNQHHVQNPYQQSTNDNEEEPDQTQALYATVLDVINRASQNSEEGASISFIAEQMAPYSIDESQVRLAIEYLSSEGHIYPTFDEEHFKT